MHSISLALIRLDEYEPCNGRDFSGRNIGKEGEGEMETGMGGEGRGSEGEW